MGEVLVPGGREVRCALDVLFMSEGCGRAWHTAKRMAAHVSLVSFGVGALLAHYFVLKSQIMIGPIKDYSQVLFT